jgi:hypothetical protein
LNEHDHHPESGCQHNNQDNQKFDPPHHYYLVCGKDKPVIPGGYPTEICCRSGNIAPAMFAGRAIRPQRELQPQ